MVEMILRRVSLTAGGTYGALMAKGQAPYAVTYELPWRDNRKSVSCIPAGEYICRRYSSQKYKDTFEVTDVPGRNYILFHVGNTETDSKGCVLVGESFEAVAGMAGIAGSKQGYGQFMTLLGQNQSFKLIIEEPKMYGEKKSMVQRVGTTKTTWFAGVPMIVTGVTQMIKGGDISGGLQTVFLGLSAIFLRDGIAKKD